MYIICRFMIANNGTGLCSYIAYICIMSTVVCKCCVSKGILVVVRAVISESSSDSNQAFGLSILTFSWLLAVVMSSALSGVTADPIGQYNLTLSSRYYNTVIDTID